MREFFPKKTNFDHVTPGELNHALNLNNNRSRKCLGWKTAYEGSFAFLSVGGIRMNNHCIEYSSLKSYSRVNTIISEPMADSNIAMDSGTLFSKTIDLTKYVDIKNIKVE